MPLYEYACSVCKHRFELLQKFSDEPAKVCVQCGGPVVRLLSSPAIQFKGTGWYVTDYAGKGAAATENRDETKPAKSDDQSTTKAAPASGESTGTKETSSATAAASSEKPEKS